MVNCVEQIEKMVIIDVDGWCDEKSGCFSKNIKRKYERRKRKHAIYLDISKRLKIEKFRIKPELKSNHSTIPFTIFILICQKQISLINHQQISK